IVAALRRVLRLGEGDEQNRLVAKGRVHRALVARLRSTQIELRFLGWRSRARRPARARRTYDATLRPSQIRDSWGSAIMLKTFQSGQLGSKGRVFSKWPFMRARARVHVHARGTNSPTLPARRSSFREKPATVNFPIWEGFQTLPKNYPD